MNQELIEHIPDVLVGTVVWFTSVATVAGFFRQITKDADQDLAKGVRRDLSNYLQGIKLREEFSVHRDGALIPVFTFLSNRLFGDKLFSIRSFCVSSLISVLIFSVISTYMNRHYFVHEEEFLRNLILYAISVGFVFNVLVDYFSLASTRWLLQTKLGTPSKIALDIVLTLLIYLFWMAILISLFLEDSTESFLSRYNSGVNEFFYDHELQDLFVFPVILTTFTTSIWLWLHGLSQVTVRMLNGNVWLIQRLNIEETPIRVLGLFTSVYVFLFGCVGYIGYLLII